MSSAEIDAVEMSHLGTSMSRGERNSGMTRVDPITSGGGDADLGDPLSHSSNGGLHEARLPGDGKEEDDDDEEDEIDDGSDRRPLLTGGRGVAVTRVGNVTVENEMADEVAVLQVAEESETSLSIMLQVLLPYLIAGFGMVGAGMVLDVVQVGKIMYMIINVLEAHYNYIIITMCISMSMTLILHSLKVCLYKCFS
jgi:hypothetical protein